MAYELTDCWPHMRYIDRFIRGLHLATSGAVVEFGSRQRSLKIGSVS